MACYSTLCFLFHLGNILVFASHSNDIKCWTLEFNGIRTKSNPFLQTWTPQKHCWPVAWSFPWPLQQMVSYIGNNNYKQPTEMSIYLPSLVLRKWNGFWLSWGVISSQEWLKVTSGWKWHWVRSKNHWIVFINQWRWTMSFSSFLHSHCS